MSLQNLHLFQKRVILLYLNASDKIKKIAYLSKSQNRLVYSGKAWESLFSTQYDPNWRPDKFTPNILPLFSDLKGLKTLHLTPNLLKEQVLVKEISNIQVLILSDQFYPQQILKICKQPAICQKINQIPHQISKLHIKAYWNRISQNQQLTKEQINKIDKDQATPLHYAIQNNSKQTIELLIKKGADVNAVTVQGQNSIHYAVSFADASILIRLIYMQLGANFILKDLYGRTPIYYARIANKNTHKVILEDQTRYLDPFSQIDLKFDQFV